MNAELEPCSCLSHVLKQNNATRLTGLNVCERVVRLRRSINLATIHGIPSLVVASINGALDNTCSDIHNDELIVQVQILQVQTIAANHTLIPPPLPGQ